MQRTFLKHLARWALAAACLGTAIGPAAAGAFTRGCAARDMQVLMLIEGRESANTIPAEQLSDALFAMMDARMVCYEGRVLDALAMYDNITRSIAPSTILTGQTAITH